MDGITRVDFRPLAEGGDNGTGALTKLDASVGALADAADESAAAATDLTARVGAVEAEAASLDTRVTAAQTSATNAGTAATNAGNAAAAAQTTASTANTTANTAKTNAATADAKAVAAQTTANAALPKTGASTTPGLQLRSGLPPSIAAIEASNNSTNLALNVTNGGNSSASAVMSFLLEGVFRGYFGIDTDAKWKVGNGSNAYLIWHQGNTTVDANNFIKKA
jgi:hypothetical protein